MRFRFTAPLWEWSAQGGWFFVTLPEEYGDDVREVPRMRAEVFDPISGGLAPAGDVLRRFVQMVAGELQEEGDLEAVESSVRRLIRTGTGAERQRAAFAIDGMAGVRRLLDATIVANHGRSGERTASNNL